MGKTIEQAIEDVRKGLPFLGNSLALNHAGIGPQPISSRIAEYEQRRAAMLPIPSLSETGGYSGGAREMYAALFGVQKEEIALTRNTAEGVNTIAQGYPWKQGDRILTVSVEYPSNVYPWWNIKDKGVEIVTVEERNGRVDMDEFIDSIDETITLVAISHVEFASGFMFDLDRVAKVCRERNVFLFVDIAQSAGVMSVDLSNVDAAAWPTWKWLMGPLGMGGFYLAAQHLETIKPVFVGTDGMEPQADYLTYDFKLLDSAQRFEFSTGNCIGAIGVFDALERVQDILGPRPENSPLMSAVLSNCDRIIERFTEFDVSLYSSQNAGERSGILSFETAGDPAEVAAGLTEANIEVAARGGRLRISPHYYTTDEDIDRLCSAMQKVMSNLGQK